MLRYYVYDCTEVVKGTINLHGRGVVDAGVGVQESAWPGGCRGSAGEPWHFFHLKPEQGGGRTYCLRADSQGKKDAWMRAIERAVKRMSQANKKPGSAQVDCPCFLQEHSA
jgi:hypothetical protein